VTWLGVLLLVFCLGVQAGALLVLLALMRRVRAEADALERTSPEGPEQAEQDRGAPARPRLVKE
jgi:hypothetical protein